MITCIHVYVLYFAVSALKSFLKHTLKSFLRHATTLMCFISQWQHSRISQSYHVKVVTHFAVATLKSFLKHTITLILFRRGSTQ